ncbi:MAG: type 1 glutamine amidotransferase, partial [Acidimicrobiales bacterium]
MPGCLIVQHVPAEGPYLLALGLAAAGVAVDVREVGDGAPLPAGAGGLDGLVVMGGPMSARSDQGFPTRGAEVVLLADAVARGVPTLGVCLGAQLLAAAAGGRVEPGGAGAEIGWGPVHLAAAAADDPLLAGVAGPSGVLDVLHWHGETFTLPPAAVLLASSDRYPHQAFRLGPRAWGLQFHVEVDLGGVRAFVDAAGAEAAAAGTDPGTIVARAEELLGGDAGTGAGGPAWPGRLVADRFAGQVLA